MTTLAEYSASRELLGNLTQRELRGKYKRSALGWAGPSSTRCPSL
jgi:ABC-type polysaccharide/polyol phosphate export permease